MTTIVVIVLMVAIPLLILSVMLWRLLSDIPKRGQRVAGIGPFDQLVDLSDGEHVLDHVLAVYRETKRYAYAGTLAFTEKRLIFAAHRGFDHRSHSIRYEEVSEWHPEPQRQLGIGVVVPRAVPSIILRTHDGEDYVYLPSMGADIVEKAKHHLPREETAATSEP